MAVRPDHYSGGQQGGTGAPGISTSLRNPLNTERVLGGLQGVQTHCSLQRSR